MMSFLAHLKRFDWQLVWSSFALVGIGLISLYSSSLQSRDFSNVEKQAIFFGIGILLMLLFSFFDWRVLRNDSYTIPLLYLLGVIALAGLFFLAPEIRGIKRWYRIGEILVDPIEYIRIILILLLAKYFSKRHIEIYRIRHIVISGIYFGIPIALIFFQPELGSILLLSFVWIAMLLVAGIKLRHLLLVFLIGIIVASSGWAFVLKDYQKNRVLSFIEPGLDPLGLGWSQYQSKIAIANGGLFGQGLGKGTQTQYGFLSEPQTDFIFASIAEEFGFVGVAVVCSLFLVLLARIIKIGMESESNFPRLFSSGIAATLIAGIFINIGMNLGLLPIVGLPLPLVSYGGSGLIMTFLGLGVLQSIKAH
ncbi:MAG: FtsW/RodA/SpoVE family cell cycle protein [bacterium]|nr:FtsW/RodA/SpoVE family cell cycle protein [bacterium]